MSEIKGLSESVALQRLEQDGPNTLPQAKKRSFRDLLKEVLLEPMVSLLIGCGAIYLLLGDRQEAFMLLGFLALIVSITLYQERKTDRALEVLKTLASPRAWVIREGQKKRVSGSEIVFGDTLILQEGDRVPADARIVRVSHLMADESLLTGESLPVSKRENEIAFAGSTLVRGQAIAEVIATGHRTELGKIGKILQTESPSVSRLQLEMRGLVKKLASISGVLCVLVVFIYGLARQDWLNGLLSGLTLAMAILPNELPAVLMIFLTLGAWRISKRNVLTRKMTALESLGGATVLCVDKTGTLTKNQMSVRVLYSDREGGTQLDLRDQTQSELPEVFHPLVEYGILASSPSPFDPMEKAVHEVGDVYLKKTEHLHPDWRLAREYPVSAEILAMSQVWSVDSEHPYVVGAKGAPEAILDLCHLEESKKSEISIKIHQLAAEGLRVLGVAQASHSTTSLPRGQHDYDFKFLGLLGLSDPVRESVPQSMRECHDAQVRVIMITGDHAHTAKSIAREIGLKNPDEVITGSELAQMDEATLMMRLKTVHCYARMVPEQKLRLVKALQKSGEVVAMTGDGVNDAPALKAAQIGIAMGGRGTDVARESASLVLLEDDFTSIVEAMRVGRGILDNLRSAMLYLLAIHVPIAGISILPAVWNVPMVLMPVHIAFLHLIIEPACSIVFEAEPLSKDAMRKKPCSPDAPLFSRDLIVQGLTQGLVVLGVVGGLFFLALSRGYSESLARTLTFTALIFSNIGLILINRSRSRSVVQGFSVSNRAVWWVILGALALLAVVLAAPFLRGFFRFEPISFLELGICLAAGVLSVFWFEWRKISRLKTTE